MRHFGAIASVLKVSEQSSLLGLTGSSLLDLHHLLTSDYFRLLNDYLFRLSLAKPFEVSVSRHYARILFQSYCNPLELQQTYSARIIEWLDLTLASIQTIKA